MIGGRAEGEDSAWRWVVYSPAGEPAAHVTTRVRVEILEIGREHVIGKLRDGMEREVVVVYRLTRG